MDLYIGIVLNYKRAERKKDELFCISQKEFLKIGKDPKYKKYTLVRKGKRCVPADVAIGMYLESIRDPNFNIYIDYITPDEISVKRFHQNDIVFVIIYDLLESFHLSDRSKFENYKSVLKSSKNVYPPYNYQKFINNKCEYYSYLHKKGIPVAPTHCIKRNKWLNRNSEEYVNRILSKVKKNNWKSIITKPVYGQESKDFQKYTTCSNGSLECQKGKLNKYLSKNIPKYKSIIIQEYIPNFDKNAPEIRMFFISGVYRYSVVTYLDIAQIPIEEGGKYELPEGDYSFLMEFGQRVMDSLPKLDLPDEFRSPILTRIDIGSGLEDVPRGYFVNEVEFVPSLYIEEQSFPVVEEIANNLLGLAIEYSYSKLPIKVLL